MKQKPDKNCNNCMRAKIIGMQKDILCKYEGVVAQDYYCSQHKKFPVQQIVNKCISCKYFASSNENNTTIGFCSLFVTQLFDGLTKNACKQFAKISRQGVS